MTAWKGAPHSPPPPLPYANRVNPWERVTDYIPEAKRMIVPGGWLYVIDNRYPVFVPDQGQASELLMLLRNAEVAKHGP